MAVAAQDVGLLFFGQRMAKGSSFVFHLGVEVGGELGEQIVVPLRGQVTADGVEVAIDETVAIVGCHADQSSCAVVVDSTWWMELLMDSHSTSNCSRVAAPAGERR